MELLAFSLITIYKLLNVCLLTIDNFVTPTNVPSLSCLFQFYLTILDKLRQKKPCDFRFHTLVLRFRRYFDYQRAFLFFLLVMSLIIMEDILQILKILST